MDDCERINSERSVRGTFFDHSDPFDVPLYEKCESFASNDRRVKISPLRIAFVRKIRRGDTNERESEGLQSGVKDSERRAFASGNCQRFNMVHKCRVGTHDWADKELAAVNARISSVRYDDTLIRVSEHDNTRYDALTWRLACP